MLNPPPAGAGIAKRASSAREAAASSRGSHVLAECALGPDLSPCVVQMRAPCLLQPPSRSCTTRVHADVKSARYLQIDKSHPIHPRKEEKKKVRALCYERVHKRCTCGNELPCA